MDARRYLQFFWTLNRCLFIATAAASSWLPLKVLILQETRAICWEYCWRVHFDFENNREASRPATHKAVLPNSKNQFKSCGPSWIRLFLLEQHLRGHVLCTPTKTVRSLLAHHFRKSVICKSQVAFAVNYYILGLQIAIKYLLSVEMSYRCQSLNKVKLGLCLFHAPDSS